MASGIYAEVKKRIELAEPGTVFLTSDFTDIATTTTVRKCLGRQVEEKIIRRIMDGVYEKPIYSKLLKEYIPANPDAIACAIARSFRWTIAPCGDVALNKLGLSTQVPVVWSYISDGPYRKFSWDNITLSFKHRANREISFMSETTTLVIEALKTLGKERIDDSIILSLKNRLPQAEKKKMLAAKFYKEELIPQLNVEMKEKLGEGEWISVDTEDEMVVNFYYPQIFEAEYLRSCVRLEIGPLAEWLPCHETSITPFAAEKYPDIFSQKDTSVLTIDVERTFWEKLTILHKIANFPEGKPLPARYARHLYDVYNLGNSWVKESAFKRKELLEKDVAFKQKFYYAKGAHYETATLSSIELLPRKTVFNALQEDYQAMKNMIYGNIPEFKDILVFLEKLQKEIHGLE